jgi:hypothetical protein
MRGGCLCGGVAYEIDCTGTPIELCHCSRCRAAYGTAFAATFYIDLSRLRWLRGEELIRVYDAPIRDAPPAYRHSFCAVCGSPLPIVREELGFAEIPAGAIEGGPGTRPARHIFTRFAAPWFEITDELPRYERHAPRTQQPVTDPTRPSASGKRK